MYSFIIIILVAILEITIPIISWLVYKIIAAPEK